MQAELEQASEKGQRVIGAIVLIGPPGAGKGTQARALERKFGVPRIETGAMIRAEVRAETEVGKAVEQGLAAGRLMPDELANELVRQRLRRDDCDRGFVLDGYPRTAAQAREINGLLAAKGLPVMVFELRIGYTELIERITGRQLCPQCGAIYHRVTKPSRTTGICDVCKARLLTRSDDNAESIGVRWKAYEEQTRPVLDFFRDQGFAIHALDGTASRQEIARQLCEWIGHEE